MSEDLNQTGLHVGLIAAWIEAQGNKGQLLDVLEKADLPVEVLKNSRAYEDIMFFADGSKSTRYGTYYGWYVRKDPYWKSVWGQRYGWDTEAGRAVQAAIDEHKTQAQIRKLARKPPKLTSWDKVLITRFKDKVAAAESAFESIRDNDFVILDTETVDLSPAYLVQLAVIDPAGHTLIDTLVNPQYPISEGAREVHGIEDWQLVGAPYFPDIWPKLCEVVQGKQIIIYNAAFDLGAIESEVKRWRLTPITQALSPYRAKLNPYRYVMPMESDLCAMLLYAQFYGEWNEYHHDYKWQRLEAAASHLDLTVEAPAHSALGDCLRTLGVLRGMSDFYIRYLEMMTWKAS